MVCLLGLDDGLFPRAAGQDGDDLLLARPEVGDRDLPGEDRQLLLDALLAATEHLVITFEGRDQHLNQPRPPCVPVAELLEVVDRTARSADGGPGRTEVVVEHPLQPFDPRNFRAGALSSPGPWRFDATHLAGAQALAGPRRSPSAFLPGRLPPLGRASVPLTALTRFLEHPVRAFLRERLGLYAGEVPEISVSLRVEMSPLERWGLGERLLVERLSGTPWDRAVEAERGRGLLPPGPLGEAALDEVAGVVTALVGEVDNISGGHAPPTAIEVNIVLPDGRAVVGTVPGVRNGAIVRCTFSKLAPKHRLRAWAQFVALSAAHPQLAPSAVTIGQAESSSAARPRLSVSTFNPLAGDGPDGARPPWRRSPCWWTCTSGACGNHCPFTAPPRRRGRRRPDGATTPVARPGPGGPRPLTRSRESAPTPSTSSSWVLAPRLTGCWALSPTTTRPALGGHPRSRRGSGAWPNVCGSPSSTTSS